MLYFPLQKTKIFLVLLSGLIVFHAIFLQSKRYSVESSLLGKNWVSEEQYERYLYSLDATDKVIYVNDTKISFIFNLSEQFQYFFYLGYFLIVSAVILSARINENKIERGN